MRARARRVALPWALDAPTILLLIALAVGGAYVVLFVVQLPRDITQLGWNSSVGSGFVMSETLVKTGTGGFTLMGSTGQWVPLWFGLLSAELPLHRELWGVAPTLLVSIPAIARLVLPNLPPATAAKARPYLGAFTVLAAGEQRSAGRATARLVLGLH